MLLLRVVMIVIAFACALPLLQVEARTTPPKATAKPVPKSVPQLNRSPRDVAAMTPREKRCYVRSNQPAASVLLNRSEAPRAICVQSCEAKLISPQRVSGRISALTIYTGRACRLPAAAPKPPPTRIAKTRPARERGG